MKILLISLAILATSSQLTAQDFKLFSSMFKPLVLPYTTPDATFSDYPNEEEEVKSQGEKISEDYAIAFLGAFEGTYDVYQAVGKIEMANYTLLLIFEISVNTNDGKEKGRFVVYTLNKQGEYIGSRIVAEKDSYYGDESWETSELSVTIDKSMVEGDENKILLTYTAETAKENAVAKYGGKSVCVYTSYDVIADDGTIKDGAEY